MRQTGWYPTFLLGLCVTARVLAVLTVLRVHGISKYSDLLGRAPFRWYLGCWEACLPYFFGSFWVTLAVEPAPYFTPPTHAYRSGPMQYPVRGQSFVIGQCTIPEASCIPDMHRVCGPDKRTASIHDSCISGPETKLGASNCRGHQHIRVFE